MVGQCLSKLRWLSMFVALLIALRLLSIFGLGPVHGCEKMDTLAILKNRKVCATMGADFGCPLHTKQSLQQYMLCDLECAFFFLFAWNAERKWKQVLWCRLNLKWLKGKRASSLQRTHFWGAVSSRDLLFQCNIFWDDTKKPSPRRELNILIFEEGQWWQNICCTQ